MGNENNLLVGIGGAAGGIVAGAGGAVRGVLGGVAGTAGGFVAGGVGGVVNVANNAVSSAATVVDGAVVGVGDFGVKAAGLAVVGLTSFVDVICGYARGVFGTAGGFINNTIVEAVDVVGGKGTAHLHGFHKDGNPKQHFGEMGGVLESVLGKDGGLNGVRSSLSWSSKPTKWGPFNPFFGSSESQELSFTLAADESAEENSAADGFAQLDSSENTSLPLPVDDNGALSSLGNALSSIGENITQTVGSLQEAVKQPVNLLAGLLDNKATDSQDVEVPALDGLSTQANDLLDNAANAVAVVM